MFLRLYNVFKANPYDKVKKIRDIDVRGLMKKLSFFNNKNVIAERLRYYRERKGLTQGQLAARLQTMNVNIDQQMISRIERNQRLVTDYEFACLRIALDITERDLLSDFYDQYAEKE